MAKENTTSQKKSPAKKSAHAQTAAELAHSSGRAHAHQEVTGRVVSNKMQKTIVVRVDRQVKHEFYKKFVRLSQKVKVHDEKNDAKPGDTVLIVQTKPMSKDKRWALKKIIRRATLADEVLAGV